MHLAVIGSAQIFFYHKRANSYISVQAVDPSVMRPISQQWLLLTCCLVRGSWYPTVSDTYIWNIKFLLHAGWKRLISGCSYCECAVFVMLKLRATRIIWVTIVEQIITQTMTEERVNQQCFIKFLQLNISFLTWPRFKTHQGIIAIIAYNCFYRSVSRQRAEITRGERSAARSDQSRACCDMQHMQFGRFVSTRSCCLFRSCCRCPAAEHSNSSAYETL